MLFNSACLATAICCYTETITIFVIIKAVVRFMSLSIGNGVFNPLTAIGRYPASVID